MVKGVTVDPLEALADAIMSYLGWYAGSRSNRNRNPGLLRSSTYAPTLDDEGYAIFRSLPLGYEALLDHLRRAIMATRVTASKKDRTLLDLLAPMAPDQDSGGALLFSAFCAQWMTRALGVHITWLTLLRDIADEEEGENKDDKSN